MANKTLLPFKLYFCIPLKLTTYCSFLGVSCFLLRCNHFPESSPESAKDALLSVLNKSGEMDFDFGEDTLQTFVNPTKVLPPDPLRVLDPLQGLDIYRSADMSILASRSSHAGLYNFNYPIEEQTVSEKNQCQSDLGFASSLKTDLDAEEVSEELENMCSKDNRSIVNEGKDGRKYSLENSNVSSAQSQHDPLLSPYPDSSSQKQDPLRGQTIKNHLFSYDSGLSTLSTSVESSHQMNSAKTTQSAKKLTHYRSMSDYGLPHKAILEDVNNENKGSESASLSSSLPANQKGKIRAFKCCLIILCFSIIYTQIYISQRIGINEKICDFRRSWS